MGFKVTEHMLVPEQRKLSKEEKAVLLAKYCITDKELPKVLKSDPAIRPMNVEAGDVIKIIRKSMTAGKAVYYRVVIRG